MTKERQSITLQSYLLLLDCRQVCIKQGLSLVLQTRYERMLVH